MLRKFLDDLVQYSISLVRFKRTRQRNSRSYSRLLVSLLLKCQNNKKLTIDNYTTTTKMTTTTTKNSNLAATNDCDMRQRAHRICSDHLGGAWARITPNEMSFTPISGGLSNLLFCCTLPKSTMVTNGEPNQVLLRLYGEQSRNSDMSAQNEIFNLLSQKDLGPKLYRTFDDGRLEEFLPATSLTAKELMNRDISRIIAKKLVAVHNLDVPILKGRAWLMERLIEWRDFVAEQPREPLFDDTVRNSTREIARFLMTVEFGEEIKFLGTVLDRTSSPLVFSHNDLHQGNILLAKHSKRRSTLEKRIILIDFEYCSYNYRAYDIANHFSEWCFEYDTPDYPHFLYFEDRLPSRDMQLDFVRHYIEQKRKLAASAKPTSILSTSNGIKKNADDKTITNGQQTRSSKRNLTNGNGHSNGGIINNGSDEEEALLDEIKPFFMAASLLWTLWCIKSAHSSNIKFGYWEHAMTRWRLYQGFKSSYLKEQMRSTRSRSSSTIMM